jgi:hypothetical protein
VPLFVDIETIQQEPEQFMIRPEDVKAPSNYGEEAAAKYIAKKQADYLTDLRARTSLEPLLGGIVVAVGIARDDQPARALLAASGDETGERALLEQLDRGLAMYPTHPLVAWNGMAFDFAFLSKRALRHGLHALARRCHVGRSRDDRHVDPYLAWSGQERHAIGRLVDVARFLGVPVEDQVRGSAISSLWESGELDQVRSHVLSDVVLLREVFWRMAQAGWVPLDPDEVPDLPVRPPRVQPRQALYATAAELQVVSDKEHVRRAAEAAGIPWLGKGPNEDGPIIDAAVTDDQLRTFIAGLQSGRAA